MNIAFAHFRVGETDGVSLEMDKWRSILEGMGHNCIYIAGSEGNSHAEIVEELHFKGAENMRFVQNCYKKMIDYSDENVLELEIYEYAERIEKKVSDILTKFKIDLVIPNNIWSLGWHLPAAIAFTNIAKRHSQIKFLGHCHDFYWERAIYSNPVVGFVGGIINNYMLPKLDNTSFCVINDIAREKIKEYRGIDALVVPNVFDFNRDDFKKDEYNSDFRSALGIGENDIVILQATRISDRKAIEFGVDVVSRMTQLLPDYIEKKLYNGTLISRSTKIYYVFAGMDESLGTNYFNNLKEKIKGTQINFIYANDIVKHSRGLNDGKKIYSLWDSYIIADFITYTSILEGWGNQLLEAVYGKLPLVLYEYPVFLKDLKRYGLKYISLGHTYTATLPLNTISQQKTDAAALEAMELLCDKAKYIEWGEHNYRIGEKYFSYSALSKIIDKLLKSICSSL